ncbi:hypothetical protein L596_013756 [Steinernema carpocapsae]|uniref:Uncharacterized protein n=1 Tax=Steinernema carpocapsae TaxID=34508 RepID=A0A4U5P195_STECR|nr:hypothetical protein L596_013756 [Steinernema carpocapsae]
MSEEIPEIVLGRAETPAEIRDLETEIKSLSDPTRAAVEAYRKKLENAIGEVMVLERTQQLIHAEADRITVLLHNAYIRDVRRQRTKRLLDFNRILVGNVNLKLEKIEAMNEETTQRCPKCNKFSSPCQN